MPAYAVFANDPSTTVSSGGTDAPASGTPQTWTVASSAGFPAAVTGTSLFHVGDPATALTASELIAVTNVSGTTWTVTRGAEGTIPVAHTAGFTIQQVVSAGDLGSFAQAGFGDLGGTGAAPTVARINGVAVTGTPSAGQVIQATSSTAAHWATASGGGNADPVIPPSGDTTGATDVTNLQNALTAARSAGGGRVKGQAGGVYYLNAALAVGSNVTLDMTDCAIHMTAGVGRMVANWSAVNPVTSASDAAITAGQSVITTSLGASASAGQSVVVAGAGGGPSAAAPLCGLVSAATATTITVTNLDGTALTAGNTVSAATVTLYNRDANVAIIGGFWNSGTFGGAGFASAHVYLRHLDQYALYIQGLACTVNGFCISIADARAGQVTALNLSTQVTNSDGIHLMGPLYGITINEVTGTTGDDVVSLTGSDFPQWCDVSGNIVGVQVRSIQASSVLWRLFNVISGAGNLCDDIVVTGTIRGTPGSDAIEAVRMGDDVTQATTTGGTYGLVDFGTVAPYPTANLTGFSHSIINLYSPAADTIRARVDYGNSQYAPVNAVQVTGSSAATIRQLEVGGRFDTAGAPSKPYAFVNLNAASVTVNYVRLAGALMNSGPGTNGGLLLLGTTGVSARQADIIGCQAVWPSNSDGTGAVSLVAGSSLSYLNFTGGFFGPCIAAVSLGGSANSAISFSGGTVVSGAQYVAFCGGSGGTYTFAVEPSATFTGITVANWHPGLGTFQFNVYGEGSSGNVLTSNGAGALPTWQAPSGGGGATPNIGLPPAAFGLSFLTSYLGNANSVETPGGIVCLGTPFTVEANVTLSSLLGVFLTGVGATSGGTNAIGIYHLSSGTWTQLGATGDMSTILTTAGTAWATGSLGSSISLTAGQIYAAVINLHLSTNPSFAASGPGAGVFPVIGGVPAGGFYFSASSLPATFTQASVTMTYQSPIFGGA